MNLIQQVSPLPLYSPKAFDKSYQVKPCLPLYLHLAKFCYARQGRQDVIGCIPHNAYTEGTQFVVETNNNNNNDADNNNDNDNDKNSSNNKNYFQYAPNYVPTLRLMLVGLINR